MITLLLSLHLLCSSARQPQTTPYIQSVTNRGLLFTDNAAGVDGTDAGYSVPVGDRTLWLFGDVFLRQLDSTKREITGAVSATGLTVAKGAGHETLRNYTFLTDPKTNQARYLYKTDSSDTKDTRLWPLAGCFRERDKRLFVFTNRVRVSGKGPLDFVGEGTGISTTDSIDPLKLQLTRIPNASGSGIWWSPKSGGPVFGCAVTLDAKSNMVYVAGVQNRSGRKIAKMARVDLNQIDDLSAYQYLSALGESARWSKRVEDAVDILGLTDFPDEMSISYNSYLSGYLAAHSVGLGGKVRLSLASSPWGPYHSIGEIGTPHRAFGQGICYAGKEHPELAKESGRVIYITYVDGDRYWLHLLEVRLDQAHP